MQAKEKGNAQRASGTRAGSTRTLEEMIYNFGKKMAGEKIKEEVKESESEIERGRGCCAAE